jgi:murein L,D-transpeptidase YafK
MQILGGWKVQRRRTAILAATSVAAAVVIAATCARPARAPATVPAPAAASARPGPWNTTYALYNPALFGPERPLADLVKEHRLRLLDGKIRDAALLLNKSQRRLELWAGRRMIKAYRVQLGGNPVGRKTRRGDERTPEGRYFICRTEATTYCRTLWISYPNLEDARLGLKAGVISPREYETIEEALKKRECPPQDTKLGGYLMFHGQLPEHTAEAARSQKVRGGAMPPGLEIGDIEPANVREFYDWTQGCAALFNPDIRELYDLVPDGAPITIVANGPITLPAGR